MEFIDRRSVYQTVLNVSRALFDGETLSPPERETLSSWILTQQNHSRGFAFYPTVWDREHGIRLITGERLKTQLAANNGAELETLRVLKLLQPKAVEVRTQLHTLFSRTDRRLAGMCYGTICPVGECAHASVSVLRYRTVTDADGAGELTLRALDLLRGQRTETGRWRTFPFYFTLLWLTELVEGRSGIAQQDAITQARDEIEFAIPACKRLLDRGLAVPEESAGIRHALLENVLDITEIRRPTQRALSWIGMEVC